MVVEKIFDVIGMGNALLDLTVNVDDSLLSALKLIKGHMKLVDEDEYMYILNEIADLDAEKSSGGSASNTIKGISILGGHSAFMGMIGTDEYGDTYEEEVTKSNVKALLSRCEDNTGVAITFITPDGERTFATYLGASLQFSKVNIDEQAICNSKILHIEGFFLEPPEHRIAALTAMDIAKANNILISLDLADQALILRNKEFFSVVLDKYVDIVFVNEHEAKAFTGLLDEDALHELSKHCTYAIVKLGARGSLIKHYDKVHTVDSRKVEVINTNGAGDAYAAGILFGIAHGLSLEKCGEIASMISSKVVNTHSATINEDLKLEVEKIIEKK
jgi:sugar/nucleoside kinase (ribokinase family)